jgi:hypothetical protein
MAYSVGIIPAAGRAVRFGGLMKELLPIGGGLSLLSHTCDLLERHCDEVIVITRPEKIAAHAGELSTRARYAVQGQGSDIWAAILTGLQTPADRYYFAMPDTYLEMPDVLPESNFVMGTFETCLPERFGVLVGNRVINKQAGLPIPALAWGFLSWSQEVRDYWLSEEISEYTQAINRAISAFGCTTFALGCYYDMAAFEDYAAFLMERTYG